MTDAGEYCRTNPIYSYVQIAKLLSVWFKNLVLYRLSQPFVESAEAVSAQLDAHRARPCGQLESFSYGWVAPIGSDLVLAGNGCILIKACKEGRLLPPAVVRETLEEKIAEIEANEGRNVSGREKKRMREDIYFDLLPKAFTRRTYTHAYIAPKAGWLVVDATSPGRAEELVTLLRHSVASLKLEPFVANTPPTVMSQWLASGNTPEPLAIQEECEMREPGPEGAVLRCQREDLRSGEVQAHLRSGKEVHRLALAFGASLSFVLCADLTVKRLRFVAAGELDEQDDLDEAARLDANFAYMTSEVAPLLDVLDKQFG